MLSNKVVDAYLAKFGGTFNQLLGPEFPELTDDLLNEAIKNNEPLKPYDPEKGNKVY